MCSESSLCENGFAAPCSSGFFDVVCVGILVADVIAKPVDVIPGRGKLGRIDSVALYSGGCAMSSSIDMSVLGAKTAIIGKIGKDNFGSFLRSVLESHGVNTKGLVEDANVSTSASVVLSDSGGERTFLHSAASNDGFREEEVDYDIVKQGKIAFVAGTNLLASFDGEPTAVFLKKAREMGKTTALDTAWDATGRWMELLAPSLPYLDYFIPSYEEAAQLSGKTEPAEIAKCFFDKGVKHVAIKLGSKGCYYQESADGEGFTLPTFDGSVVDTTGAGDSFCAGFLYGIVNGMSMRDACIFGNAVGTMCVGAVGAISGIRPAEEVRKKFNL